MSIAGIGYVSFLRMSVIAIAVSRGIWGLSNAFVGGYQCTQLLVNSNVVDLPLREREVRRVRDSRRAGAGAAITRER